MNLVVRKNEFLWKFWGPVEPFDRLLPIEAMNLGAITALITDHYHYWEPIIHGYHEHYMFTDLVRGHEFDPSNTDPIDTDNLPKWVQTYLKWRKPEHVALQYYRNVKDFKDEKDFHERNPSLVLLSTRESHVSHPQSFCSSPGFGRIRFDKY